MGLLQRIFGRDSQPTSEVLSVVYLEFVSTADPNITYSLTAAGGESPLSQSTVWQIAITNTLTQEITFPDVSGRCACGFEHAINNQAGLTGIVTFLDALTPWAF